jgi:drug/metabolite transporter (DMT)-like permease
MTLSVSASKRVGIFLTVLATLCWGSGTVLTKYALSRSTGGLAFFLVQLLAALLFLAPIALLRSRRSTREFRHAWLGFLEPGLAYALGVLGLKSATATQGVLIQALESFMILAVAFILFGKKVKINAIAFGLIAILGVLFVNANSLDASLVYDANFGQVLIFMGTLAAAIYVVLSGRLVDETVDPLLLVFWQLLAATAVVGLLVIILRQPFSAALFHPSVIISGLLTYALAFVLYLQGMKTVELHTSAFLLCLTPIFGVGLSAAFLHEPITGFTFAGAALIVGSLLLLTRYA